MPKFKFKSARKKDKLNLISNKNEIIDTEMINGAHIEMFSNKKLLLDGCYSINEYENDYIKLKLKKGVLLLCGDKFYIESFEDKRISIKGNFTSIEFCV